jgi:hypothetical protein
MYLPLQFIPVIFSFSYVRNGRRTLVFYTYRRICNWWSSQHCWHLETLLWGKILHTDWSLELSPFVSAWVHDLCNRCPPGVGCCWCYTAPAVWVLRWHTQMTWWSETVSAAHSETMWLSYTQFDMCYAAQQPVSQCSIELQAQNKGNNSHPQQAMYISVSTHHINWEYLLGCTNHTIEASAEIGDHTE